MLILLSEKESLKINSIKQLLTKAGFKEYIGKILRLKAKPWRIALSLALGVFIGLAIPIGFQTIIVVPIALLLQCNILLATTATLVSNPFTVLPLYYLNFKVGEIITTLSISDSQIESIITNPTWVNIQEIGYDAIILFFSGSFLQGTVLGVATYLGSLSLIKWYRKRKELKLES
jgi:uncharacterized protein (DUF2062 family)